MTSDRTAAAPNVAVIVVAFASDRVLPGFLASVPGASIDPLHVVVADNAPRADGQTAVLARDSGAQYLGLENRGYGAAINAAEQTLPDEIEWLLISNPDVVLEPGAIDILRHAGDADASVGVVGPCIVDELGVVYPSARSVPSLRTGVGHALLGSIWPGNPWSRAYRLDDDIDDPQPRDAGWLSGACLLVRRSVFRELAGFDEEYFMYFEDVDFGLRVSRAGYRNHYEPAARVTHTGAHSTADSAEMLRVHHRSAARFLDRKYAGPLLRPLRWVLRTGLRVRSALTTRAR